MAARSIDSSNASRTRGFCPNGVLARSPLPTLMRDRLVAELVAADDLSRGRAERGDVGRVDALDQVERARLQVGEQHGGVRDRLEHDALEMDVRAVPVAVEALDDDAVLRHALDEAERPAQTGFARTVRPPPSRPWAR
jgi:hypothetical protein